MVNHACLVLNLPARSMLPPQATSMLMRLAGNDSTFWHSNNSLITPNYTSFTVSSTEKYDRNRQHRERAGRASSYHYTTCKQAGNTAITGTGEYDRSRQHPEQYGRDKTYHYISS